MSLDLDWSLLDETLAVRFLETINRALETSASKRPSFIGDIHFSNLQFGSDPPDVSIRSITDIWPDFVSLDEPPLRRKTRHATPASNATTLIEPPTETFPLGGAGGGEMPVRTYTQFDDAVAPHRVYGPGSVVGSSVPGTPGVGLGCYQQWSTALASRGIRASGGAGGGSSLPQTQVTSPIDSIPPSPSYFQHWQQLPSYCNPNSRQPSFDASSTSFFGGAPGPQSSVSQMGMKRDHSSNSLHPPQFHPSQPSLRSTPAASLRSLSGQLSASQIGELPSTTSSSGLPSLQMHLSLLWPTTTFRLTISTSLLINYPSPAFMSLPLQLSATGFVMRAGLIVVLEGEQHRAHLCLVEEETDNPEEAQGGAGTGGRKQTPGQIILPQLTFESEVGEHEKHVLKNVGKVEKFIAEVIRKGLEDELVYPNYYTVDLPGGRGRS
ncbi:Mitochondrial distribution and morphology protein 12 [Ustilago sp. UG-2017a]|nr:Mitochondrial distribution and morphology protein 12 [Ustilago sp. UG-2017a]